MPRQTEPNANNSLGELLRGMMPGCGGRSESTQTFPDYPGRHADVLIAALGCSTKLVKIKNLCDQVFIDSKVSYTHAPPTE